jgi:hypothetical protein
MSAQPDEKGEARIALGALCFFVGLGRVSFGTTKGTAKLATSFPIPTTRTMPLNGAYGGQGKAAAVDPLAALLSEGRLCHVRGNPRRPGRTDEQLGRVRATAAPSLHAFRANVQAMDRPRLAVPKSLRRSFGTPLWSYRLLPRQARRPAE